MVQISAWLLGVLIALAIIGLIAIVIICVADVEVKEE